MKNTQNSVKVVGHTHKRGLVLRVSTSKALHSGTALALAFVAAIAKASGNR